MHPGIREPQRQLQVWKDEPMRKGKQGCDDNSQKKSRPREEFITSFKHREGGEQR